MRHVRRRQPKDFLCLVLQPDFVMFMAAWLAAGGGRFKLVRRWCVVAGWAIAVASWFWSGGWGREATSVGVGAELVEGPDSVAAHRDLVEAAVELDGDRLAAGGAAEGKAGVMDLPAGVHGTEMAEWPCSGGARGRPGPAVPDPGFGLEFGAVAVPVDERESRNPRRWLWPGRGHSGGSSRRGR
jgi:hypothetical protein